MAFKSPSDDSSPLADINITPLVDVMLVLLVIFMVTAPLMESGIPIQLPKTSAKALSLQEAQTKVTVNLSKDGKIFINKEEVSLNQLTDKLNGLYKDRRDKEIFIRADETLPYGVVAQTMALIKNAGIHKIGLVTTPGQESKK